MKPIALLLTALTGTAFAAPLEFTHQGRLLDPLGAPLDGAYTLVVSLYDGPSDETPFWFDDVAVTLQDGYFSARLGPGSTPALTAELFEARDAAWVGVAVDGGAELLPRTAMGSVPFSLQAAAAPSIGEVPVTASAPAAEAGVGKLYVRHVALQGGDDAFNSLLLRSDTTNGATNFVDSSPSAHTVSRVAPVDHSTDQQRFGASAIDFRGGGYLTVPDSPSWDFPGDFTIDFWLWTESRPYSFLIVHRNYPTNSGSWHVYMDSVGTGKVIFQDSSYISMTSGPSIPLNTWTHVAVVRSGSTATLYFDGVQVAQDTSAAGNIDGDPAALRIGDLSTYNGDSFDGMLDEIRISKGIARWTAPFTPPATPYTPVGTETHLYLIDDAGAEHRVQLVDP